MVNPKNSEQCLENKLFQSMLCSAGLAGALACIALNPPWPLPPQALGSLELLRDRANTKTSNTLVGAEP